MPFNNAKYCRRSLYLHTHMTRKNKSKKKFVRKKSKSAINLI